MRNFRKSHTESSTEIAASAIRYMGSLILGLLLQNINSTINSKPRFLPFRSATAGGRFSIWRLLAFSVLLATLVIGVQCQQQVIRLFSTVHAWFYYILAAFGVCILQTGRFPARR